MDGSRAVVGRVDVSGKSRAEAGYWQVAAPVPVRILCVIKGTVPIRKEEITR